MVFSVPDEPVRSALSVQARPVTPAVSWDVFGSSPVSMLIVEVPSATIVDANGSAARLFGTIRSDLIGTPFADRVMDLEEDLLDEDRGTTAVSRLYWGPNESLIRLFTFVSSLPASSSPESPMLRLVTLLDPNTTSTGRPHDSLTGLLTRDSLASTLEGALNHPSARAAVTFIDLDNFKDINDTHGHLLGDEILITTAHAIRSVVRSQDTIIRFGGDEFMVIMPRLSSPAVGHQSGQRIVDAIARTTSQSGHRTTASVGVALAHGAGSIKHFEAVQAADSAMYAAKAAGGNQVFVV